MSWVKWDLPNLLMAFSDVFSDLWLYLAFLNNWLLQSLLNTIFLKTRRFNFSHLSNFIFSFVIYCSTVFTFQYFFQVNRFYVSLNLIFIGTYIVALFTLINGFLQAFLAKLSQYSATFIIFIHNDKKFVLIYLFLSKNGKTITSINIMEMYLDIHF